MLLWHAVLYLVSTSPWWWVGDVYFRPAVLSDVVNIQFIIQVCLLREEEKIHITTALHWTGSFCPSTGTPEGYLWVWGRRSTAPALQSNSSPASSGREGRQQPPPLDWKSAASSEWSTGLGCSFPNPWLSLWQLEIWGLKKLELNTDV